MPSKTDWNALGAAVVVAVVVGLTVGLGVGVLARYFGLPTWFVGPFTGGIVGALTPFVYQKRAKPPA